MLHSVRALKVVRELANLSAFWHASAILLPSHQSVQSMFPCILRNPFYSLLHQTRSHLTEWGSCWHASSTSTTFPFAFNNRLSGLFVSCDLVSIVADGINKLTFRICFAPTSPFASPSVMLDLQDHVSTNVLKWQLFCCAGFLPQHSFKCWWSLFLHFVHLTCLLLISGSGFVVLLCYCVTFVIIFCVLRVLFIWTSPVLHLMRWLLF